MKDEKQVKVKEIIISPAKIRNIIDKSGLNKNINKVISELKTSFGEEYVTLLKQLKKATAADKPSIEQKLLENKPNEELLMKHERANHEKYRFSHEVSIIIAVFYDDLVTNLLTNAFDNTINEKKAIVLKDYLFNNLHETKYYNAIKSFTMKDETKFHAKKSNVELIQQINKLKKDYKLTDLNMDSIKQLLDPKAGLPVDETEEEDIEDSQSFKFYIQTIGKKLTISNEKYSKIRISKDLKVYISDLLNKLTFKIINLCRIITECVKFKTISNISVIKSIEYILNEDSDVLENINIQVVNDDNASASINKNIDINSDNFKQKFKKNKVIFEKVIVYDNNSFNELMELIKHKVKLD